jgi:hypothetical protein
MFLDCVCDEYEVRVQKIAVKNAPSHSVVPSINVYLANSTITTSIGRLVSEILILFYVKICLVCGLQFCGVDLFLCVVSFI